MTNVANEVVIAAVVREVVRVEALGVELAVVHAGRFEAVLVPVVVDSVSDARAM